MKPSIEFPDAELLVKTYLDGLLTESVGTFYPASSTDSPVIPFVQVADDGSVGDSWPVTDRVTVRVTVWHNQPTPAKALAQKVRRLLVTHPGSSDVLAVEPLTRNGGPTRDPDTGLILVSQTFRVSLASHAVA